MDDVTTDVASTLVVGVVAPMAKGSIGGREEQILVVCAWKILFHTKHLKIISNDWKHFTSKQTKRSVFIGKKLKLGSQSILKLIEQAWTFNTQLGLAHTNFFFWYKKLDMLLNSLVP